MKINFIYIVFFIVLILIAVGAFMLRKTTDDPNNNPDVPNNNPDDPNPTSGGSSGLTKGELKSRLIKRTPSAAVGESLRPVSFKIENAGHTVGAGQSIYNKFVIVTNSDGLQPGTLNVNDAPKFYLLSEETWPTADDTPGIVTEADLEPYLKKSGTTGDKYKINSKSPGSTSPYAPYSNNTFASFNQQSGAWGSISTALIWIPAEAEDGSLGGSFSIHQGLDDAADDDVLASKADLVDYVRKDKKYYIRIAGGNTQNSQGKFLLANFAQYVPWGDGPPPGGGDISKFQFVPFT